MQSWFRSRNSRQSRRHGFEVLEERTVLSATSLPYQFNVPTVSLQYDVEATLVSDLDCGCHAGTGTQDNTDINVPPGHSKSASPNNHPTKSPAGKTPSKPNLPDASVGGIMTAAARNATSQAPNNSPIFKDGTIDQSPELTLYVHPDDPLAFQATTEDGTQYEYFAAKRLDGTTDYINQIRVTDPKGDETVLLFDSSGRITSASSSGVIQQFHWVNDFQYVHTILVEIEGQQFQANVSVDMQSGVIGDGAFLTPASTSEKDCGCQIGDSSMNAMTATVDASMFSSRTQLSEPSVNQSIEYVSIASTMSDPFAEVLATTTSHLARIFVSQCGEPVTEFASVQVTVIPDGDLNQQRRLPATHVGGGFYEVTIPTEPSPVVTSYSNVCSSIAAAINTLCTFGVEIGPSLAAGCASLAAAIRSIPHPAAQTAATAVFVACEGVAATYTAVCGTVGQSPGPGAPSLADALCSTTTAVVESFFAQNYTAIASATVSGAGHHVGSSQDFSQSSSFVLLLSVDVPGETSIAFFTTSPVDPAPFQSYVATAQIFCPHPSGSLVTISIVGTDGYSDSVSFTLTSSGTVSLFVPGAEDGVVDTITVSVEDGPERTVVLVF